MTILQFMQPGASFDEEATHAMGAAFEAACAALHDRGQPTVVQEIIARRIIEAATGGERDPASLVNVALEALGTERRYG